MRGSHLASKAKVLQYVNGERDSHITGHGAVQITDYAFGHYVLGQIPIVLDILGAMQFSPPQCCVQD